MFSFKSSENFNIFIYRFYWISCAFYNKNKYRVTNKKNFSEKFKKCNQVNYF